MANSPQLIGITFLERKPVCLLSSELYPVRIRYQNNDIVHQIPRVFHEMIPLDSLIEFHALDETSKHEGLTLEFLTRGYPGRTMNNGSRALFCEIHVNDKKYKVCLSHELEDIIPSFSILRVKKEGSIKKTVAKPSS